MPFSKKVLVLSSTKWYNKATWPIVPQYKIKGQIAMKLLEK